MRREMYCIVHGQGCSQPIDLKAQAYNFVV